MDELKCGDVVVLNSGSPNMTVGSKGIADASVYCLWFDGCLIRIAEFPQAALKEAPPKD